MQPTGSSQVLDENSAPAPAEPHHRRAKRTKEQKEMGKEHMAEMWGEITKLWDNYKDDINKLALQFNR
jgi:hypothetical protein